VEWDNIENAKGWLSDASLRAAMQEARVEGIPSVTFLNEG
jgi:hypothetical protein